MSLTSLLQLALGPAMIHGKIEFFENLEGPKYKWGLSHSCHKLTQLSKQLESFCDNILLYEINRHSIKFHIPSTVCFLVERHGLWQWIIEGGQRKIAATTADSELVWKMMRISICSKFIDDYTKHPSTGELLMISCSLLLFVILCIYRLQRALRFKWSTCLRFSIKDIILKIIMLIACLCTTSLHLFSIEDCATQ